MADMTPEPTSMTNPPNRQPVAAPSANAPATTPAVTATTPPWADASDGRPPHTKTESTLAPTSEFMRYVLAALPSRYILRGGFGLAFNEPGKRGTGIGKAILNFFGKPGDFFHTKYGWNHDRAEAAGYNASLGIGSLILTTSYSATVYKDIKNIFSEAVGEELGKPTNEVSFNDIQNSHNKIVRKTLENFWQKLVGRLAIDSLFIPASLLRNTAAGDLVLGLKGGALFLETWKRKTTMFEDLVTFVNNKINPNNGLGQPIVIGEVFDLYQHYTNQFHPDKMFSNVLEQGGEEGLRWSKSQPIFQRITELMNATYAYKHQTVIDPSTGFAARNANFGLPKFIYMMGHDLIDPSLPEQTMALIEIANARGIPALKEAQKMLGLGSTLDEVMTRYSVAIDALSKPPAVASEKNGVIAKGSTVQLDAAPVASKDQPISKISVETICDHSHADRTTSLQATT